MKKQNTSKQMYSHLVFWITLLAIATPTAIAQPDTNSPIELIVSNSYKTSIAGQQSNDIVLAREISQKGQKSTDGKKTVLFSPESKQALVVGYTNDVYFMKGRFLRVTEHQQSFWITISRPTKTAEFTIETTINMLMQSTEDIWPRENAFKKLIDLRPILKPEDALASAQGNDLRWVTLALEQSNVVATFESRTHLLGKVILDDQLNPISMAIIPDKKSAR